MRRVMLLAAFLAACGEEQVPTRTEVSPPPNITGTWRADLSGDGFLTSDTTFIATVNAISEFRFTQSGKVVSGEYVVEGTISTLDPDGDAFSFPLIATGLVDGELTRGVNDWKLTVYLRSFSDGADASFTTSVLGGVSFPAVGLPPPILGTLMFEVRGLVQESRTYQFNVTGKFDVLLVVPGMEPVM